MKFLARRVGSHSVLPDASVVQDAICAICGRRRQDRRSISIATPSSTSTMTPSPMIASLVGRFMIKPSMEKGGEANLRK
jgi:hypothetical protein